MSKSKTVLEMAVAGIDGRTEMSWEVDEEVNQDKNGKVLTTEGCHFEWTFQWQRIIQWHEASSGSATAQLL